MKNQKKLNLNELKVQSFVTHYDAGQGETLDVKGGYPTGPTGAPSPDPGPVYTGNPRLACPAP